MAEITDPLNYVTRYGYNKNDEPNMVIDAEDNNTLTEYNERGLVIKVTDANGGITRFGYTVNSKLSDINDPNGNITRFEYDGFNRLVRFIYPDDSNEQFAYDKNGNVTRKTTRKGDSISYEYDSMNRMLAKTRPGEPNTVFTYDIAGKISEVNDHRGVADGGGVTKFKYDRVGRITEVNDIYGRTVKYEYDKMGLRTKITYPSSSYYTYEYDGLQRLYKVKISGGLLLATYYYDELSRRTQLKRGATTVDYQYDIGSRLMKITNNFSAGGSLIYDYNNYDRVGNRLSMKVNDSNAHVYEYDNLYQLTIADYNNGSQNRYDYDPLGNRTMLSNGSQTTYESNKLNQYSKVGAIDYQYDKNGNLTFDGTYTYIYDCENRLIEAKQGEASIVTYAYDFKGRRTRKAAGANVMQFSYDGDQIIADYNDTGVLLAKYVYGPRIDEPIYLSTGGNGYYYFFDGLGSVVALARNGYAPTEVYSYDVFGEPNRTSSIGNRYLFTGREFESETGLYYYRARYYNPTLGRFIQADLILYISGLNSYIYVNNNPTRFTDPKGLMPCSKCQDRYRNAIAGIAAAAAQCHNDCGPSDLGPAIGLCMASCARTGGYFPICTAVCGAASQIPWAACHYLCGVTENNNIKDVKDVLKQCLAHCCDE